MQQIIAIIPTYNRPESLLRAVESVNEQSLSPTHLIIVHESEDSVEIDEQQKYNTHITQNLRSHSLSGAINHALDYIIINRHEWDIIPEKTWVALLDDDDWWDKSYLEKCSKMAQGDIQQVVSGIYRYDQENHDGFQLSIPELLGTDSFLIKNPHIQGSNLFVRMDTFLQTGGFDEALQSCTDRDFCIRMFERPNHRWAKLNQHLVHHDARNTGRISDSNSHRKKQGLTRFAMKHQFRMDEETWRLFLEMAKNRFGIDIENECLDSEEHEEKMSNENINDSLELPFELSIAVTISNIDLAKQFFSSVYPIVEDWSSKVRLVICLYQIELQEIEPLIANMKDVIDEVVVKDEAWANQLAENGELGPWFLENNNRNGISWGRCLLHRAIVESVADDCQPVIWIVDEDIVLDSGRWNKDEDRCLDGKLSLEKAILFMHESRMDVGVGHIIGDPPLPHLFTQRTQLIDLYYTLLRTKSSDIRIGIELDNERDLHHDLASHRWDHLEFPAGAPSEISNKLEMMESILAGRSVTRETHSDWKQRQDGELIVRGGNTLILNPNVLNEWSNVAPKIGNVQLRRGDSFWTLFVQRIRAVSTNRARSVDWIPFAITQSRLKDVGINSTVENIRGDIIGSMLLREFDDKFPPKEQDKNRRLFREKNWCLEISERTIMAAKIREARLISNLFRIRQLKALLNEDCTDGCILDNFWNTEISTIEGDELTVFLSNLDRDMILFRSRQPKVRPNLQIQQAWDIYLNSGGSTNAIIAGHGSEGVVFRENGLATKILHDDIAETEEEHPNLKDNLAIMKGFSGLPKNYSIQKLGQKVIVRYDWVDGQHPTFKTEIQPWLNLLRACRENGCVYWDLKPQNLILTPDGELVIIDIGRNLKPFSEHAWQSMIRKAFLCWRWWFRLDLRSLLTLSIRFDNPGKMPELTDIDYFIQAIEIHDKADLHDPWFVEIMNSKKPGKLLDWGCGKGTLSKQIADIGFDVEAWDPITDYIDSVADHPQVKWIDGINEVKEGYYDTAISTLVLWVIEDEEEVVDVLRTLRRGISESGKVIATVCHPLQMCTQCSTSVERPLQQMEFGRLTFEKRIRTTNRIRVEHVRSLERLEMLAARANLRISGLIESPGVDINRCAVMPEYLAIEFKPIPKPKHTDVELLILACSMDHSIIEKQVKHVVKQLGGRERFEKVTVVTDDSVTGFVRPWDEPDIDEYKAGLERLIQEEIITQVLWAPKNEDDIQKLNERWYGMSVPINKAVNGQPVHTSLWGLEQSSSTYVLQIDVDIMIHRDWSIDPTDLLIDCLIKKEAVTATLPILSESNSPPRILDGIDWRTEVRFCIFDRQKIMRLRPMKNSIEEGKWQLPWHKTMDARIEQTGGGSLRLIDGMNWFVHPQNEDKVESLDLHRVRRRIERGEVSDLQKGHVDMVSWEDSHGIRNEGIVVIVRGRNTPYSFIRRHIDSMQSQTDQEFGIIWIDAASDDYSQPHFEYILDCEFPNRVTFIWNEIPRPRCENILLATKYIANPEAILILLDADDAFAGPEIISHVRDVFEDGVEVAVGGMLRLDKQQSYPVDFVNPRTNRGGNVWQHLKCFRKRCIEIVPVEMFRMDDEFIHDEDDWALMLPIVEVSNHHHQFTRSMMIYTISENKMLRSHEERDERIARIVGKPSLR